MRGGWGCVVSTLDLKSKLSIEGWGDGGCYLSLNSESVVSQVPLAEYDVPTTCVLGLIEGNSDQERYLLSKKKSGLISFV